MHRIRRAIAARPLSRALLVAVLALALVGQAVAQPGACCPNGAEAADAAAPHHPAQPLDLADHDTGGCHGQAASAGAHIGHADADHAGADHAGAGDADADDTASGDAGVPVPAESCDAQCLAACAGGVVALPTSPLPVDRSAPASHAAVSVPMSEAPPALRALRPPITG